MVISVCIYLQGHHIDSVGWNWQNANESTTGAILLGTSKGINKTFYLYCIQFEWTYFKEFKLLFFLCWNWSHNDYDECHMRTIKFISCTDYLELVKKNMFGKLGTLMSKVKVTTVTDLIWVKMFTSMRYLWNSMANLY